MEWEPRLRATLAEQGVELTGVRALHGGACQENFVLETTTNRLVLRSDAPTSLPGSIGREVEAEVINVAVAGGVPTPAIRAVVPDLMREGAMAVVMDFAPGVAIGAKVTRMDAIRSTLGRQLADALARIHAIRPGGHALAFDNPQNAPDGEAVTAALRFCREMMDRLPARATMERIYAWLETHRPADEPTVLVHGDYRVGNFLVGEGGLEAVLDWEFAHWGCAAEDLAWLSVRDWRFGKLDRAMGGLTTRAEFMEAYMAAGGRPIPGATLRWWEILGNLRWATGARFQTLRATEGGMASVELMAIGRRAAEMEWEALRRMEVLNAG